MNRIKKIKIFILILFVFCVFNFLLTTPIVASTQDTIMKGFKNTGSSAGYEVDSGGKPKEEFIPAWGSYVKGLINLMAFLFLVLMIYGGWLWMTAKGNEEQVQKAKNIMIQATIGLGIVIGARIIVELALTYLGTTLAS